MLCTIFRMSYTQATLFEVLRCSSIIPLGVWHNTREDIPNFHGYFIPNDTMVITNLYALHHDPEIWQSPELFSPDRFLSVDKNILVKREELIPWSTGRRVCVGENLSKDVLFLMLTGILQRFKIELDPIDASPNLNPIPGPVSAPKEHKIVFCKRQLGHVVGNLNNKTPVIN